MRGRWLLLLAIPLLFGGAMLALSSEEGRPAHDDDRNTDPAGGFVIPAEGKITGPRALAAADDRLYVFDDTGWLHCFDYEGNLCGARRIIRTRRGFPNGVIVEPDGSLLIADSHESRLLRLTRNGERLAPIGGGYGAAPGQFVYPQRIVRTGGRYWVTEFGYRENCRVQWFGLDGTFERVLGGWGMEGAAFQRPAGIAAGPDGRVYVADASHRILVWSPEGEFLFDFGEEGREPGRLNYPWGLAADDRWLYVAEYGAGRISRFDFEGRFAGCFGGPEHFRGPRDLVLADGHVFLADTGNDRVVRFRLDEIPWRSAP